MEGRYGDQTYTSICSERTLQSNAKGFFLTFADHVAETVGEQWINNVFGKLKTDRQRIHIIYEDEKVRKAMYEVLLHVQEIYRKKSSEIAQARRLEGDKAFKNGDTLKALSLYSQSVLRAQPTGENSKIDGGVSLALALWGRSQVLIATNKFSLALSDIQTALKENLPTIYKAEAFWKMGVCYKATGEENRAKVSFSLAEKLLGDKTKLNLMDEDRKKIFEEAKICSRKVLPCINGRKHKEFPNASKKLTVKESSDKGRYVVANEKIQTGETIVVEPAYAACLLPECFGTHCHHCFERLISPVGCDTCSRLAFCTPTCRDAAMSTYHRYECKFLDLLIGSGMSILSHTALRMITQNPLQRILEIYKDRSKEKVYSLCTLDKLRKPNDFLQRTLMAAFLLRCLQKSGYFKRNHDEVMPTEEEYQVGELLLFHLQMLQFNAHEIYETRHGPEHRFRTAKAAYIGVAVYPTVALFNHDCYPGVTRYFVGKSIVINAVRPLQPGDLIAENYGPIFTRRSLVDRQRSLSSRYWFKCKCIACTQNWPNLDNQLSNVTRRIRCPNTNCTFFFTLPVQNETIVCPQCKNNVNLTTSIAQLSWCEEKYKASFEALEEQQPQKAIKLLCQAIDKFHRISSPPHRDTHLGQEVLRACLADSGNKYECLLKS